MPGAHQRLQADGEDVARDAEVALQLGEAADAEERLADDQERPALAEHLHRAADRTGLVLHHVTVSRWRCRSSTDITTCCSRSVRSRTAPTRATSTWRAPAPAGSRAASSRSSRRTPTASRWTPSAARTRRPSRRSRTRSRRRRRTPAIEKLLALEAQGALRVVREPGDLELGGPVEGRHAHRGRRGDRGRAREPARAARARAALARDHVEPAERVRARRAVRRARLARHRPRAHRCRPRARPGLQRARDPRRPRAPQRARVLGRRPGHRASRSSSPTRARTRSCPRPAT